MDSMKGDLAETENSLVDDEASSQSMRGDLESIHMVLLRPATTFGFLSHTSVKLSSLALKPGSIPSACHSQPCTTSLQDFLRVLSLRRLEVKSTP